MQAVAILAVANSLLLVDMMGSSVIMGMYDVPVALFLSQPGITVPGRRELPHTAELPSHCTRKTHQQLQLRTGETQQPFANLTLLLPFAATAAVYDVFTFDDEFDMLKIRLTELWDVVDWFVLIETGELHFEKAISDGRYRKFLPKIKHIKQGIGGHPLRDHGGNSLGSLAMSVLKDAPPSSIIMLADVSEVPYCSTIRLLSRSEQGLPLGMYGLLEMPHRYNSCRWRLRHPPPVAANRTAHLRGSVTAKVFYRSYLDAVPLEDAMARAQHLEDAVYWIFPDAGVRCSFTGV